MHKEKKDHKKGVIHIKELKESKADHEVIKDYIKTLSIEKLIKIANTGGVNNE